MEHYDRMFAYYEIGVTTLETFFQMMGRVRKISTECRHVLIAGIPLNLPTNPDDINKDFVLKRNNEIVPPILERIHYEYDDNMNVSIIKNDDYRVTMHNVRTSNLSASNPFSRFYFMVGDKVQVYYRKTLPSATFEVHLDQIAKEIKSSEFTALCRLQCDENYIHMEPGEQRTMQEKKHQMLQEAGLTTQSAHFFNSLASFVQYEAWKNKFQYMQKRLVYGSIRNLKSIGCIEKQEIAKQDTISSQKQKHKQ